MKHLELEEFTVLMNTQCHKLTEDQYFQMLECAVSSSVVLMTDLLKDYPQGSKERMQLDDSDLALMDKFFIRIHKA